jgi:hypothetical protein
MTAKNIGEWDTPPPVKDEVAYNHVITLQCSTTLNYLIPMDSITLTTSCHALCLCHLVSATSTTCFDLIKSSSGKYCHDLRVSVTYKTGFGLNDWIHCALYIHTTRDYRQNSAIAVLHTLQFTVIYALGFSVFTSHILATDL